MNRPTPRLDGFEPWLARRMATTIACTDTDDIPKVDHAGETRDHHGTEVQVMHNGLLVEAGGYYGDWIAEVIRCLRGHHEPQEELVFHRILERLREDTDTPTMIEFGSYWTYYGTWFCYALPGSRAVALEPDPVFIEVGRRNAALNDLADRVTFVHAAIGADHGQTLPFTAESDGQVHHVAQHDLASLMAATGLDHVDLILADVQGAETLLLERARGDFQAGRVRFLVVSTHHHSISGDPLTHQKALALLTDAGAHILAEHTVGESCSGDGLIAVSFDSRDKDLHIPVTHLRYRESLYGEVEHELAAAHTAHQDTEHTLTEARKEIDRLAGELARTTAEADTLRAENNAIKATKLWRWAALPRAAYARVKGR